MSERDSPHGGEGRDAPAPLLSPPAAYREAFRRAVCSNEGLRTLLREWLQAPYFDAKDDWQDWRDEFAERVEIGLMADDWCETCEEPLGRGTCPWCEVAFAGPPVPKAAPPAADDDAIIEVAETIRREALDHAESIHRMADKVGGGSCGHMVAGLKWDIVEHLRALVATARKAQREEDAGEIADLIGRLPTSGMDERQRAIVSGVLEGIKARIEGTK